MSEARIPIIIHSKNKRIADIMRAIGGGKSNAILIRSVRISLTGPSPEDSDVDLALRSATKPPKSRLGRYLKRWFLRAQYAWAHQFLSQQKPSVVICWNGMKGFRFMFMLAAKRIGHQTLYLEESPLPERISVDKNGINFGNSVPRDSRFFLEWAARHPEKQGAWSKLRDKITQRQATAANVMEVPVPEELQNETYIFCPLQVPGDSQLTVYGGWCDTVEKTIEFLKNSSAMLPKGVHFRLKEHPRADIRFTTLIKEMETEKFKLDNASDTFELVKNSAGVLTVNSSVGLEALFFDRPVATLGHAFFTMDGIVSKISSPTDLANYIEEILAGEFSSKARIAFLDYLSDVHFPRESEVLSRAYGLLDLNKRDSTAESILQCLEPLGRSEQGSAS